MYNAHPITPSEDSRAQFGNIAIVLAQYSPESNFNTFAKDRSSGAGKGAAQGAAAGALAGIQALGSGSCGGSMCGAFVLLLPIIVAGGAVVGGVIGGISGAVKAVPETNAQEIESMVNKALDELRIQETMSQHVLNSGTDMTHLPFSLMERQGPASPNEKPDYSLLKEGKIDAVLEVSVNSVGFEGGEGEDPSIAFFMNVHTRLIRLSDGAEVYSEDFEYKSKARHLTFWADNNAKLLREEFDLSYRYLAEKIIEGHFLLVDFPLPYLSPYQFCMLRPLYPEYEYGFFKKSVKFVQSDSLQPTLKWELFPRDIDKEDNKSGLLEKITDVTYDIKIWRVEDDSPMELVYARQDLPKPYHQLEHPLAPQTNYFWTVRARFKLNGNQRIAKWSYSRMPFIVASANSLFKALDPANDPCRLNHIPSPNYFRFTTPER